MFCWFQCFILPQIADAAASCLILLPMLPLLADSGAILPLMTSARPQNDTKMLASCLPQPFIFLHFPYISVCFADLDASCRLRLPMQPPLASFLLPMLPLIADSGAILLLMTSAKPQNDAKMLASCLPPPRIFLHFRCILLCFAKAGISSETPGRGLAVYRSAGSIRPAPCRAQPC